MGPAETVSIATRDAHEKTLPCKSIISIRQHALQQKREHGQTEVSISVIALVQLCELAVEHPLVDKRASSVDWDYPNVIRLRP
jgi:hypothetical protein